MRVRDPLSAKQHARSGVSSQFSRWTDRAPAWLILAFLLVWLSLSSLEGPARAQTSVDPELSPECAALVERLTAESRARKAEAVAWALANGMPIYENDGYQARELMALRDGRPVYYTTTNVQSAIAIATDQVREVLPWNLDGEGLRIGVWDEGVARRTHPEFLEPDGQSRIAARDSTTISPHSTHVAGTIAAAGIDAKARGMAPRAGIESYDWNEDTAQMTAYTAKLPGQHDKIYVSNHSYGLLTGWVQFGKTPLSDRPAWYWPGIWSGRNSYDDWFGQYNSLARKWDEVAYFSRYYLAFAAAGNDRNDAPTVGEKVFYYVPVVGWQSILYSLDTCPAGDGVVNGGFGTVSGWAAAKNIMTVGAVEEAVSDDTRSCAKAAMTTFSCWGPTDDGRIKPDIVATGVKVYSTAYDPNNADLLYDTYDGTSMATPSATGSAALLVQLYERLFPDQDMRSSTLKGLILHTADDLGRPGPDYCYGWGLMNTRAAAELIQRHHDSPAGPLLVEGLLNDKNLSDTYYLYADGITPIRLTLCWTDPPAPATNKHDDRTPKLLNDLDLRLIGLGGAPTYYPYILNAADPCGVAGFGDNQVDNVEQIYLAPPCEPGVYEVRITYKKTLTDREQNYSLISSAALSDQRPPLAQDADLIVAKGSPVSISLSAVDDGLPGVLRYVIASLPAHGVLEYPTGDPITKPMTLGPSGNQVVYRPAAGFAGGDSFTFYADDGGVAPFGGASNTAVVTIATMDLVTREYQVSQSADDATGTLDYQMTYGRLRLGQYSIGARFQNVDIPAGVEIVAAHLKLRQYGVVANTNCAVHAEATGNADDFTSDSTTFCVRPRTQAFVAWSWQDNEPGGWQSSPDIGPVLREVFNRPDWSPGNALALLCMGKDLSGVGLNFYSWDDNHENAPKLEITYTARASSQPTPSPGAHKPVAQSKYVEAPSYVPTTIALEATDDGLPNPPGRLSFAITALPQHGTLAYPDGTPIPQPVTLSNHISQVTYRSQETFVGNDAISFCADDGGSAPAGGKSNTGTITITVRPNGALMVTREFPVVAPEDDVYGAGTEQFAQSATLSVGRNTSGMRFRNVDISRSSEILSAHLEICMVTAQVSQRVPGVLRAQASGDANDFAAGHPLVQNLGKTTAAVPWAWEVQSLEPDAWYQSPELKEVVQEVIDRPDWSAGHALGVLYSCAAYQGPDLQFRACNSPYDYRAARLQITYIPGLPDTEPNAEPNVPAGPTQTLPTAQEAALETATDVPVTVTLAATDDGLPNPPGKLTYVIASLPGHGTLEYPSGGQIAQPGTLPNGGNRVVYRPQAGFRGQDSFTFCADDGGTPPSGGKSSPATIRITVKGPVTQTFTLQLQVSKYEDNTYANPNMTSNRLFYDTLSVGFNTCGMRFRDVAIPPGSTIVRAQLKISMYKQLSGPVEGLVQAQAIGNAPQFSTTPLVCNLPRTASSVAWNWPAGTNASPCWPECWYSSPDIATVIQEIVNRPDWSAGNALAIIYSGTNAPGGDMSFCGYAIGSPIEGYAPKLEITYGY